VRLQHRGGRTPARKPTGEEGRCQKCWIFREENIAEGSVPPIKGPVLILQRLSIIGDRLKHPTEEEMRGVFRSKKKGTASYREGNSIWCIKRNPEDLPVSNSKKGVSGDSHKMGASRPSKKKTVGDGCPQEGKFIEGRSLGFFENAAIT